ncbi:MAG: ABC transporter permease subunit [Acidimicrobiia bacterium]|nr:ABC transporter permease subunit [Acidimicrobiia bacterium]
MSRSTGPTSKPCSSTSPARASASERSEPPERRRAGGRERSEPPERRRAGGTVSRAVWLILVKDLRRNLRNGFFLVMGIITPLVLAFVFNLVFGGVTSGRLDVPVGYLDEDRSEASARLGDLLDGLDDEGLLEVTRLERGTDPAEALGDRDLTAVVEVPAGFGAAAGGAEPPVIGVVGEDDAPTSVGIVRAVVEGFARESDRERIGAAAAAALDVAPPPPATRPAVALVDRDAEERLDAGAQIAAAMASLFLFIISLLGVNSLLDERRDGTLARLLAAPIPRSSVIVAKILVSVVLGVASVMVLVLAMALVLGADWGAPLGVVALVVALSVTAAALTLLVAGSARTPEAAASLQSSLAVVLAVLGGGLVPLPDGGLVGLLSRLTPHRWFYEGLRSLAGDAPWTAALPAVAALAGFTLVLGAPGLVLARRRLAP